MQVFQEHMQWSPSVTLMGTPRAAKGRQVSEQLDFVSNAAETSVLSLLQPYGNFTIQSFSRADYPKTWKLNLQCCDSQQPTSQTTRKKT